MGVKIVRSNVAGQKIADRIKALKNRTVQVGVLDPNIARYATYVEYGWVQRATEKQARYLNAARGKFATRHVKAGTALVNPPRPFLRSTFEAEYPKWQRLLRNHLKKDWNVTNALVTVGERAANDIKATIRNGGTSKEQFDRRAPLTMELLKADAARKGVKSEKGSASATDKPLQVSGALLHNIGLKVY